jgi:GNAT superfamily N-acetyltransferase
MNALRDIEASLQAHWSLFGRWSRGGLHDEDGLLWFETPIPHLPYNGVIRTGLGEAETADRSIAGAIDRFRSRGVEFLWFTHPSATPSDLGERLAAHGLQPAEQVTCMSLDLAGWEAPPPVSDGVTFHEVRDDMGVRIYSDLTARYWDIPPRERPLLAELHRGWARNEAAADGPGVRYLALLDGRPVGKGYLSLVGRPGVAAIFGMSVVPEARRRGVAAGLVTTLLRRARESGFSRVVLHSSEAAVGVYRRAGFAESCRLTIFATSPLWSPRTLRPALRPAA